MQKKVLFSQNFMNFYRRLQKIFWTAVSVFVPWKTAFFLTKTDCYFIFSEIKNSYAEKSAVFAEFHEFLSPPQKKRIFLDRSFRIYPLKNCFFCSQNQVSFFFWNKKFICRKKCCFRKMLWVFIVPQTFFGVIFLNIWKKKVRFLQKIWKKLVCFVSKKCDFHSHLGSN